MKKHLLFSAVIACLASAPAHAADSIQGPNTAVLAIPTDSHIGPTSRETQEAIATLHNVLRADPKNYDAQLKLGEIYLQLNEPAEAIKDFTAALPSSEHEARAKQGLGLAFLRLGDKASALRY